MPPTGTNHRDAANYCSSAKAALHAVLRVYKGCRKPVDQPVPGPGLPPAEHHAGVLGLPSAHHHAGPSARTSAHHPADPSACISSQHPAESGAQMGCVGLKHIDRYALSVYPESTQPSRPLLLQLHVPLHTGTSTAAPGDMPMSATPLSRDLPRPALITAQPDSPAEQPLQASPTPTPRAPLKSGNYGVMFNRQISELETIQRPNN